MVTVVSSMVRDPAKRAAELHTEAGRLRASGDHRSAAARARRALRLFERHEGRYHPDVAAVQLELGAALELADRWVESRSWYRKAAAILGRYARSRHADVRRLRVQAASALCRIERILGRYDQAVREG